MDFYNLELFCFRIKERAKFLIDGTPTTRTQETQTLVGGPLVDDQWADFINSLEDMSFSSPQTSKRNNSKAKPQKKRK